MFVEQNICFKIKDFKSLTIKLALKWIAFSNTGRFCWLTEPFEMQSCSAFPSLIWTWYASEYLWRWNPDKYISQKFFHIFLKMKYYHQGYAKLPWHILRSKIKFISIYNGNGNRIGKWGMYIYSHWY